MRVAAPAVIAHPLFVHVEAGSPGDAAGEHGAVNEVVMRTGSGPAVGGADALLVGPPPVAQPEHVRAQRLDFFAHDFGVGQAGQFDRLNDGKGRDGGCVVVMDCGWC